MTHSILIADPDAAFGQMLQQMLTLNGDYTAHAVTSGASALAAVRAAPPDLAIVDLSITDVSPPVLIEALRRAVPALRVMLIPLGESLPREYDALDVQGVLTKPFFIGDLGASIASALGADIKHLIELPPAPVRAGGNVPVKPRVRQAVKPAEPARPAAPAQATIARPPRAEKVEPPSTSSSGSGRDQGVTPRVRQAPPAPARRTSPATSQLERPGSRAETSSREAPPASIEDALASLSMEVRAEIVLLMRDGSPVAQQGTLPPERASELVDLMGRSEDAARNLAVLLGETGKRFKQLHLEGERYHVYRSEIGTGSALIVLCRADVPFGTLRLAVKSSGLAIARLLAR